MAARACHRLDTFRERKADAMDFDYLVVQTLGDTDLQADLLILFVAQGRDLVPTLAVGEPADHADTAHRLRGSARAIGATSFADRLEAFEDAGAGPGGALSAYRAVLDAFRETETAIRAYLDTIAAGAARGA